MSAFKPELVRTVRFTPYRKDMGPTFTLSLYDIHEHDSAGRWGVGYRLTAREWRKGKGGCLIAETTVLFDARDAKGAAFGHHSVDGDEAVKNVMGWLTLRPGDTDSEYFAEYTPTQMRFCEQHAEALACEVYSRFGEP